MAIKDDNNNSFDVPQDAWIEILIRLPVDSLLRFLCVSKSWYALIKSPNFITTHFNYASSNDKASRVVVMKDNYNNADPHTTTVLSSDGVVIYHGIPNPFMLDIDKNNLIGRIELSSSCNGVICVCDYEGFVVRRVALWNPAIREVNYLVLDDGFPNGCDEVMTLVGFGVNTKNNVYKVVRCRKSNLGEECVVDIYDVGNKNDSWRRLDDMNLPIAGKYKGSVYADGFCYWPVFFECDFPFVLCFDFINEVFERIPTPLGARAKHMGLLSMATFGESVAFVGSSCGRESSLGHDSIIIWLLNGEGDKKTWCKKTWCKDFSLPKIFRLCPRFFCCGKVVMLCPEELYLYGGRSYELKKVMDLIDFCEIETMTYICSCKSLACESSPNGQG